MIPPLADRRPAVHYFYDYPYEYDQTALPSTLDALRETKPAYIVDSLQPPLFDAAQGKPAQVQAFLDEYYEYEGSMFFADIYRLKP